MSNRTMTLTAITKSSKEFKDTHTLQVGGFKDGGRVTNQEILNAINKINNRLDAHERIIKNDILVAINKINDRLDRLEKRFDNLIKVNNLKE